MRQILWIIFIVLNLATDAFPQKDTGSGNFYLPYLKSVLTDKTTADPFAIGLYLGLTKGLSISAAFNIFCSPPSVSNDQILRVLVRYLEAHPEQTHKDITVLALAAFVEAWPCTKR